ncbi:phosphate ABC transporter permease PstA [Clostridia bacterium]|nr:phosphate ABC transporter permease PstA [Clostridia bacterium]
MNFETQLLKELAIEKDKKINQKRSFKIDSSHIKRRVWLNNLLQRVFSLSTVFAIAVLVILFYQIIRQSIGWLDWQFLTSNLSIFPQKAGIWGAIVGSIGLILIVIPVTIILGVSTAIYLEEYAKEGKIRDFIRINLSNLASVPSVIFGLLGLSLFGRVLHLGSSILAGGLTLSLMVLPIIVVASQEALRSVPGYLREGSYAMGATKWTTIWKVVLPIAIPGILTGSILSVSRAMGETAPLVVLGIPALIMRVPTSIMDDFTALPIQIYYWTLDSVLTKEYANLASATIVVLLVVLFLMNSVAIFIRNKFQKSY